MIWYKTGTVNVTLNSAAVVGVGTGWVANVRDGDAFLGPDGLIYEITGRSSDTAMTIVPPYKGATATAKTYALAPLQGYVKRTADLAAQLLADFGTSLDNKIDSSGVPSAVRQTVLTGFSTATVTAVTATDTLLQAIGKLQGQFAAKANLASPVFTGVPTTPTAAVADNTLQVASTAFVQAVKNAETGSAATATKLKTSRSFSLAGGATAAAKAFTGEQDVVLDVTEVKGNVLTARSDMPTMRPSLLLDFVNSERVDSRITFTRNSTATYYDGKTQVKADENLLANSQNFGAWGKGTVAVTDNAVTAPDGTLTADKIVATTAGGYHGAASNMNVYAGLSYTISFYAKAAEYTKVCVSDSSNGRFSCSFDLVAGTAGVPLGTSTGKVATITSDKDGWYRCSLTQTVAVSGAPGMFLVGYPDTGATLGVYGAQYTGDSVSGAYFWGAQVEQRDSATVYVPTTSEPVSRYAAALVTAPANGPRIDHDPITGECLGLLVEEARTNLQPYSGAGDGWVAGGTAPPPTPVEVAFLGKPCVELSFDQNSVTGYAGSRATRSGAGRSASITAGAVYVASLSVSLSRPLVGTEGLNFFYTGSAGLAIRTIAAQESVSHVGKFSRISTPASGPVPSTGADYLVVYPTGPALLSPIKVYVTESQLEVGTFPTSYIPTTTAAVTRAADLAQMTGANFTDWYRQGSASSFVVEASTNELADTRAAAFGLTSNSSADYVAIGRNSAGGVDTLTSLVANAAGVQAYLQVSGAQIGVPFRIACALAPNDFAQSANGGVIASDSTGVFPAVFDVVNIGRKGAVHMNGHVRRIAYYPTRLPNEQLQALTQG